MLEGYAAVDFKGERTIVCKCPTDGEYAILASLSAVLHHVRPEEKDMIHQRLVAWFAVSDDRMNLTRTFVEGITMRPLDAP